MSKLLKHLALIPGALGVAALLATSACTGETTTQVTPTPSPTTSPSPTPTVLPGEDEDRPPIIVSGGSVHLRAVAKNQGPGTNNNPGEWKEDKVKKQWAHDHGTLKPAKHLLVHVLYGTGSAGCKQFSTQYDVRELTVYYGSGLSFRIFIDPPAADAAGAGPLTTDAPGKVDDVIPFWLEVGAAGDYPTSVVIGPVASGTKCGLAPVKGQVHIYQRIKVR